MHNMEQPSVNNLPEEIKVEETDLRINSEGKKYEYEKEGVFYGGDYLPEPPEEIDLNFPVPPPEKNSVL